MRRYQTWKGRHSKMWVRYQRRLKTAFLPSYLPTYLYNHNLPLLTADSYSLCIHFRLWRERRFRSDYSDFYEVNSTKFPSFYIHFPLTAISYITQNMHIAFVTFLHSSRISLFLGPVKPLNRVRTLSSPQGSTSPYSRGSIYKRVVSYTEEFLLL